MHRKSLEAADQLKDDNSCGSDKDEVAETDKSEESIDESKINNTVKLNAQENNNNGIGKKDGGNSREIQIQQRQIPSTTYESRYQTERTSSQQQQQQQQQQQHQLLCNENLIQNERLTERTSSLPTDPEEFRNNSIACLRAKAQEHQAKLLGFTTDALMLVNSGPRRNLGCDANANSINHHHPHQSHQQTTDMLNNSSDNSSSLF